DAASGGAQDAAAGQGGDPAQLADALLKGQKTKAGLPHRFGQLSSGLGGGLALNGGAGLAGGIGGAFKRPNLTNSQEGRLKGLAGANRARVTRVPLAAHDLGKSAFKGANARRLDRMNRAMGQVRNADAETAAEVHSQQWDAAQPAGSGLSGSGLSGMSAGGQFSPEEGTSGGGPLATGSQNGATSVQQPSDINNGVNRTPYQGQITMAKSMLVLASAIVTVIGALAMMGHAPIVGTWAAALQTVLFGVATGLAAAATAIGMGISSKYGQGAQGTMVTVGGSITTAFSIAAMLAPCSIPAWTAVVAGIAGMASSMVGGGGGNLKNRSDISSNG
ncbi:MAG: hypothetical protein KGL53_02690, partial [Elusimicrobia bacterium]|nr:hypothetical protein [Elusimicrobiota bacterium]